jgi:hypothetical protein
MTRTGYWGREGSQLDMGCPAEWEFLLCRSPCERVRVS